MFNLINRTSKSDDKPIIVPEYTGDTIVLLHDENDDNLFYDLAPHMNSLIMRVASQKWQWKFYQYPARPSDKGQHEDFVSDLEKAFLFLPFTSATFLTRFLRAMEKDARLKALLEQTYIQPIPLRACHGVAQSILPKPLAAYAPGHERDQACAQVIAALEHKLLSYQGIQESTEGEMTLLEETKSPLLLAAPTL